MIRPGNITSFYQVWGGRSDLCACATGTVDDGEDHVEGDGGWEGDGGEEGEKKDEVGEREEKVDEKKERKWNAEEQAISSWFYFAACYSKLLNSQIFIKMSMLEKTKPIHLCD